MSVAKTLVHNARALIKGEFVDESWVLFSDTIEALGAGSTWHEHAAGAQVVDAENLMLTPGLIDTHVHGGGGFAAEDGTTGIEGLIDFHKSHGTTSLIVSLISNGLNQMEDLLRQAVQVAKHEPALLGIHLEGPFLSPTHKGAHNPVALVIPTAENLKSLISAGGGIIRSITLAPELFSNECLEILLKANVKICVGHTNADFELASKAFQNYSSILTHAFNGMNPIHHRAPGPVIAAIETDGTWMELIADGVHVDQSVATLLPPNKVILVTDAMAAAGQPDGDYKLGDLDVSVQNGVAKTNSGSIAGSTLTLERAVSNYSTWINSAAVAIGAATAHPALAYGLDSLGVIQSGRKANLVLWSEAFEVEKIWTVS